MVRYRFLIAKAKGAVIIDADEIAKTMLPEKPAWVRTVEHFGEQILNDKKI